MYFFLILVLFSVSQIKIQTLAYIFEYMLLGTFCLIFTCTIKYLHLILEHPVYLTEATLRQANVPSYITFTRRKPKKRFKIHLPEKGSHIRIWPLREIPMTCRVMTNNRRNLHIILVWPVSTPFQWCPGRSPVRQKKQGSPL